MSAQKSMPITIPATKAHRNFGDLIRRTYAGREHFIIEKDGLPVVVLISVAEYEAFMQERERQEQDKQERLRRFRQAAQAIGEEIAKTGLSEEELMAQLEETKRQVYEEYYGDNQ